MVAFILYTVSYDFLNCFPDGNAGYTCTTLRIISNFCLERKSFILVFLIVSYQNPGLLELGLQKLWEMPAIQKTLSLLVLEPLVWMALELLVLKF